MIFPLWQRAPISVRRECGRMEFWFIMSLTHNKTSDFESSGHSSTQTVRDVDCGRLLPWSADALLHRDLCGPAALPWTAADPSSGPDNDRSDCAVAPATSVTYFTFYVVALCANAVCAHVFPAQNFSLSFTTWCHVFFSMLYQRRC